MRGKPFGIYEKQIAEYENLLTDEYIEANKYNLQTRSKPIRRSEVMCDSKERSGEEGKRSAADYYGIHTAFKILFSIATAAAFACVALENFETVIDMAGIVSMLFSMLSIALSVVSAILTANGCYRHVYIPNLLFMIKILRGYDEWRKTNT